MKNLLYKKKWENPFHMSEKLFYSSVIWLVIEFFMRISALKNLDGMIVLKLCLDSEFLLHILIFNIPLEWQRRYIDR